MARTEVAITAIPDSQKALGLLAKTGAWLNRMLKGHLNYYVVCGNSPSLWWYFNEVRWRWLKSLKRRSQRAFISWEKFTSSTDRFFPSIRILHPLPCHRFDARTCPATIKMRRQRQSG
jgi:RNA-directed DNA polymerase